MTKYIFVTGGVVSGLGKGITTASLGILLKTSGFSIDAVKFDPYLNIDPGTMSPYEHGEVYVLDDGSETDLDLGHYERFLNVNLTKNSSVSAGKIYDSILKKEREGKYLGKNVQLIPHVTNYIKECFSRGLPTNSDKQHIRLIEIGGSTGDFEAEVFLESFRQFKSAYREDVLHIHLGYVPFLDCSGEFKTKPLQTSIRELLSSGLQPDVIVARYAPEGKEHLTTSSLEKIALFSNLPASNVISLPDLKSIYEVPLYLQNSPAPAILEKFLKTELKPNLPDFFSKVTKTGQDVKTFKIALVAKYPKLSDAYLSLLESIRIAAVASDVVIESYFVDAENLENSANATKYDKEWTKLKQADGIIIPGGFGVRGMEGKVLASKYARENNIPFLGICLGLQMAVVDIARNVANLKAFSSEMLDSSTQNDPSLDLVIDFIPEQKQIYQKGGTMRLGGYDCWLEKNTLAADLFKSSKTRERHRHRLEVQQQFLPQLQAAGLVVSGKHFYKTKDDVEKYLVELIELNRTQHPYFIATQSHPEFLSRPSIPHPLFFGLIQAVKKLNS